MSGKPRLNTTEQSIDPGPDNVSTPEDIAETNELESLRSMREAIQYYLDGVILDDKWLSIGFATELLIKINKLVNPDE